MTLSDTGRPYSIKVGSGVISKVFPSGLVISSSVVGSSRYKTIEIGGEIVGYLQGFGSENVRVDVKPLLKEFEKEIKGAVIKASESVRKYEDRLQSETEKHIKEKVRQWVKQQ